MNDLEKLEFMALVTARTRGHRMGRWETANVSTCLRCGMWVQVLVKPAPNQIESGGPAVAINCTAKPP